MQAKMQKQTEVENWIKYWKSTKRFPGRKTVREQADAWNERWSRQPSGMVRSGKAKDRQKRMTGIFEMLDAMNFTVEGARILDIGCGPGAVSIPFARAGAEVTALDVSDRALERLQAEAVKEKLSIRTLQSSWWTANIDKLGLSNQFDLVFATNTPALKDADCFERMIACSRNCCYYGHTLHSGGHMRMNHPEPLQKILSGTQAQRVSSEMSWFLYGFIYVYLKGYQPVVRIDRSERNMKLDWQKAADRTIRWCELSGGCTTGTKKKIRDYFRSIAADGICRMSGEGYSGRMAWKVKH
jgi:hypothetical protein